jgi:hypothetical protein
MIPAELLFRLVPNRDPEDEFVRDSRLLEFDPNSPGRRVGMWAAYLRDRIHREISENTLLNDLIETSGFIATGIFHATSRAEKDYPGFEVVDGYQFGALLLRAKPSAEGVPYVTSIALEGGRYRAPVVQARANLNPHADPDGYVAAIFDDDGDACGITAAHVVNTYRLGQRVPVLCSRCGASSRLKRKAPGLIDAAVVRFTCSGPMWNGNSNAGFVRSAVEGETVNAHFGDTGRKSCTIMLSLQTASQIKSAATPKHFLTDVHGYPGDSGSLISADTTRSTDPDLIGMYLGDADCQDETGKFVTYGYALDLKQAADLLGASNVRGDFNV